MSESWSARKTRLRSLLESTGDEDTDALALDRVLHGQAVIGKTPRTSEVDRLRFSDRDLAVSGVLAKGQFGLVELVNCTLDGRVYVRKKIEKKIALKARDQCSPQIERDILLLALKSKTEWVPEMVCAFQDSTHLSIVMHYADGGSLWDVVESSPNDGKLSYDDLKWWIPQCISAIHWCHSHGFAHRDIKPHNFVLTSTAHLQLIDFGSAAPLLPAQPNGVQMVPKKLCLVPCGTCDYISPEILKAHEDALIALELTGDDLGDIGDMRVDRDECAGGYGRETDWWSLGAMVYEMAYGVAPFFARDIGQTYLRIMDHERSLKFRNTNALSAPLVSLLRGWLCDYVRRLGRYSIDEITEQPFFDDVDWASLHTRPHSSSLHLPQFVYSTPTQDATAHPPEDHQSSFSDSLSKPFAFSALFQSSVASGSSPGISFLHHRTPGGWGTSDQRSLASFFIGFSWGPTREAFNHAHERIRKSTPGARSPHPHQHPHAYLSPAPPSRSPYVGGEVGASTAREQGYATPVRPRSVSLQATSVRRASTVRRTGPRRVVTDREAMKQLIDCVGMSARKRVLASGRKPRVLVREAVVGSGGEVGDERLCGPGLVVDCALAGRGCASEEEDDDEEGMLSPSPSPRPGSAMSISRRSVTPTISGSFPSLREYSSTRTMGSVTGSGAMLDVYPRERRRSVTTPSALIEDMEKRWEVLMGEIRRVERGLAELGVWS